MIYIRSKIVSLGLCNSDIVDEIRSKSYFLHFLKLGIFIQHAFLSLINYTYTPSNKMKKIRIDASKTA